jgi:hypothetical protein
MREWVAHNKTVPMSVLEVLADDPDERVRSAVAMKNKLTSELFEKLASDSSDSVRAGIAYNRNAPPSILRKLAEDVAGHVADAARSRIDSSNLKALFQAAFTDPYASHAWASAKGKSHWREMECLQDTMAGPLCSVIKRGGCEYVYTRNDQYFAGVDNPNALRLRLIQWHSEFVARINQFEPSSVEERDDLSFMRSTVEKMLEVIERAVELERRRQCAGHSG